MSLSGSRRRGATRPLILFRFHEEFELCRERLELLAALNPGVPIHGVYGGSPENFEAARSSVTDVVEDVHLAEPRRFMWHWLHMDLDVKHWYRAVGRSLEFDVLFDYEWDILTLDGLASIYPPIDQNTIALCALTELTPSIEREWQWTGWPEYRPSYERFMEYMRTKFGIGALRYASHGPGTVIPRRFLEQFAELEDVELVISEISYPAYAQALGFELVNNNLQRGSVVDHFDDQFFHSDSAPIRYERIVAEVLKPDGRKAFHPVKFSFSEHDLRELHARRSDGLAEIFERVLESEPPAAELPTLEQENAELRDQLARRDVELESLRGRVAATEDVLQSVVSSTSWRITKPLRTLKRASMGGEHLDRDSPVTSVGDERREGKPVSGKLRARPQSGRRSRRVKKVRERLMNAGTITTADGEVHEIFPTSLTMDRGQALSDWVTKERAASTVETGLAHAVSTLFICEGLLLAGHPDVHHVAFDPYQEMAYSNGGRQVITEAGLDDVVEIHEEDSKIGLAKLLEQQRRFDLAFVDGDHRFEGVFIDLVLLNRLVRPGGIVIVDDLYLPAVARASNFARTNLAWTTEQADIGGHGGMAAFRTPSSPPVREWDEYIEF